MGTRTFGRISWVVGLLAAAGAAGCFLAKDKGDEGSSEGQVNAGGDATEAMKSTLVLDGGCVAVKVGPKHLILSARCATGNTALEAGKTVKFKTASQGTTAAGNEADEDEGMAAGGEPRDAGDAGDAGKKDAGNAGDRQIKIAELKIHPSYAAKCTDDACDFGKLAASDAPDVAILLLESELPTVPDVPVDLDAVGQADPLLAVTSGCKKADTTGSNLKAVKTIAAPAKSVNHKGSPYLTNPQLVTRLQASYVVTPGPGWRSTEGRVCKGDIGAPVFRGAQAAVVGLYSNYSASETAKTTPLTVHHTRLDADSRFKIGTWLKDLGVATTHSCSEAPGGCVKRSWDGGAPSTGGGGTTSPGDGGELTDGGLLADGSAEDDAGEEYVDTTPHEEQLPEDPAADEYGGGDGDGEDYDAGERKKKKKDDGGCNAGSGEIPTSEIVFFAGLALVVALARRRRAVG